MPRGRAAVPEDGGLRAARRRVDRHRDLLDDQPQQPLAVRGGRRRRVPHRRQVGRQRPHRRLLLARQGREQGLSRVGVLLLQLRDRQQRLVPALLEGAGDQPVLRLACVVLALGAGLAGRLVVDRLGAAADVGGRVAAVGRRQPMAAAPAEE